jgi:hypothetical protein
VAAGKTGPNEHNPTDDGESEKVEEIDPPHHGTRLAVGSLIHDFQRRIHARRLMQESQQLARAFDGAGRCSPAPQTGPARGILRRV